MAAATQTARTSPQNSKMSSPKDNKTSLPVVTKTEGVYALIVAPNDAHPLCFTPTHCPLQLPAQHTARIIALFLSSQTKHD
jgi:ATF/CREB family transcription factor